MLSAGELLSSMLVAACMRAEGTAAVDVDAREILRTNNRFGSARVDQAISRRQVRARLPGANGIPVVTGFIASTAGGETTTLGRGASDYTATLLGSMLEAEEVEIWTDVDGVLNGRSAGPCPRRPPCGRSATRSFSNSPSSGPR